MLTRAEWLAERMKGIGASEAAAVLGVSPWSSPVDVWARKRGLIPEIEDNERLRTGRLFEEPIAQLYAEREKVTLTGGGYDLRFHPKGLPIFATPDRIVDDANRPRGLEIKTVEPMAAAAWGEEGSDQIPPYYVTQVAVCMSVTGLPEWDVAAFFGMNDFRIYRLQRDMELENAILDRCSTFWNRYVIGGEEPALDGSEACAEYLVRKYPTNRLPLIGANEEAEELLRNLFSIREQVKSDEAIQTEYENRLKAIIGEAEGVQGVCGKATWKKSKDSEKVDWEAAASKFVAEMLVAFPEIANRILEAKKLAEAQSVVIKPGSRRFLPTPTKR